MNYPASASVAPPSIVSPASPFHPGEQAVQTVAGVRDKAESLGLRMLSPELVDAQREFFARQPFVVTSHLDGKGQPWAGLMTGRPGFVHVSSNGRVRVERGGAAGPAVPDASPGDPIGLLGIEFARRRRNRINGTVLTNSDDALMLNIDQGFGNCPKYITKRPWDADLFAGDYVMHEWTHIPAFAAELIRKSDTFFIASSSGPDKAESDIQPGAWGADISHRGGAPGFLRLEGETLWFDDYPGNNLFNTLGNLKLYPRCGLLILDFDTGDLLQLAGTAELHHDGQHYGVAVNVNGIRHWRREHAES